MSNLSLYVEGARTTSRLGWAAYDDAKNLDLSSMSSDWLGERYNALLDLIPPCPKDMMPSVTGVQVRIDPGYHEWQRQHGAEVRAISFELSRRWRRMQS